MKRACAENWENIVDLAEGRSNPAAEAHVASCRDCAKALDELKRMMSAASVGFFQAPSDLIEAAVSLMPKRQKVRAGLLRSTLSHAGARAEAEDFQLVVAVGDRQSRVMYVRESDGWEVISRLPSPEWQPEHAGAPVPVDEESRFSFKAATLADTSFELVAEADTFEVPSAEELLMNGA